MLSGVGQIIGAVATSMTLIWLLVGQHLQWVQLNTQHSSIEIQKQELELQKQALESTTSSISAQIYINVIADAKQTLARHCRSLLTMCENRRHKDADQIVIIPPSGSSADLIVEALAENNEMMDFIRQHRIDPMLKYILDSYCTIYQEVKDYASSSKIGIRLFSITMENSPYEHLFATFKPVDND
jgi:hypothetical protein